MFRSRKLFMPLFNAALVLLLLLAGQNSAHATHVMGADLTWECVGPNQYLVSLTLYRDCNGINLGNGANVSISGCGTNFNSNLTLQAGYPQDITPLCPSEPTACGGSGAFGVEAWLYQRVITMPAGCNNIEISYRLCCRNNAITTLINGGADALYIEGILDNTTTPCDNSPAFLNIPTAFVCNGQQTFYNHGAFDPDGDSLVFSLTNCEENDNNSVDYAGGFSGATPLSSSTGVNIDQNTGAITFTPNATQVGVLCVLVEEFRNGVKIGETVRDLQFTVINCTNQLPVASGVDLATGGGTIDYEVTSCFGNQFCFDILGTDPNGNNTFMFWNGGIPTGSFTTQSIAADTVLGTFCWTPTLADVGQHVFTVTVQDDACPLLGSNTFTYTVNIIANPNPTVTAFQDTSICRGESVNLTAVAAPPTAPTVVDSVVWSPSTGLNTPYGTSVIATPLVTTIYQTTIYYSDGCTSEDFVVVDVQNEPLVAVTPNGTNVCSGSLLTLTGSTDQTGLTFEWFDPDGVSLGTGLTSGTQSTIDVTIPVATDTTFTYELVVTNPSTGCTSTEQVDLFVGEPNVAACINIYVSPTGTPAAAGTQFDPTTLGEAIARAGCNNTVIKMAIGTYNTDATYDVTSFLTIEGGFDPGNAWRKTSQQGATTINRTALNPLGFPNALHIIAFNANNSQGFRLQDLTITTDDAVDPGTSTYGIRLASCTDYNIVRCQIQPGAATDGATGAAGFPGADGFAGSDGTIGSTGILDAISSGGQGGTGGGFSGPGLGGSGGQGGTNPPNTPTVGLGGFPGTVGSNQGGGGGGGGSGNVHSATAIAAQDGGGAGGGGVPTGTVSTPTCGTGDGGGGNAGPAGNNDGVDGGAGTFGADGSNGALGAAGDPCSFFFPGTQAPDGQDGVGGTGGCGGGGAFALAPNTGGGGAGGGGGGEGGQGGDGGFGGGGSFGVYLYNNGANGNIEDCNISSGASGVGGVGGVGGAGGAGAAGGTGGLSGGGVSQGGAGGQGGDGGAGGQGGTGSDGFSMNVMFATCGASTSAPLINADSTFNLATQPVIFAENVNCTNATVQFTDDALPSGNPGAGVGVANWDFDVIGNLANPATGINNPDTTQYDSIGRYTIAQGVQTYTDFHNIAFDAAFKPTISTTANMIGNDTFQLCVGDFAAFASDITADTIIWNFNGAIPNPGSVQNVPNQQFNSAGFYLIELQLITDCCGDSPMDSAWLYVDPLPNPSPVNAVQDICEGETVTLELSGLAPTDSVEWSPTVGNLTVINQSTVEVSPNDTTNYVATVYSVVTTGGQTRLSCPVTVSFDVNVFPDITPNLSSTDVICVNDGTATAAPTGGTGSYNFLWNTGGNTASINGLAAGVYTVTITDASSGCDTVSSVFVNPAVASLVVNIDTTIDISCNGANDGSIDVEGGNGTAPYTYTWNDIGLATDVRTNLAPGQYCVTVTDALGCFADLCIDISEPDVLAINLVNVDSVECQDDTNGSIEVEGFGGTGLYTYTWSGTAAAQTTALVTGLEGGAAVSYDVTVTDENNCTATLNIPLPVLFPVNAQVVQTNQILCNGDASGVIRAGAIENTNDYDVSMTGPIAVPSQTQLAGNPLPTFSNLPVGTYNITVTDLASPSGCFDTISITLTEPPLIGATAVVDQNVSCFGGNDGGATVTASGGTAPYTYVWDNGEATASATLLTAGNQCVTVTDDNGCATVTCVNITEPAALATSANVTDVDCNGNATGAIDLTVSGGTPVYTYLWDNAGEITEDIASLTAGTYTVTVTDNNNCTTTETAVVAEPTLLTLNTTQVDVGCNGASTGSVNLTVAGGTAPYNYNWDNGATTEDIASLAAGVYCVTVTDDSLCTASTCVTITEPSAITLTTAVTDVDCNANATGAVDLTVAGGTGPYSFSWSNSATSEDINSLIAGTYDVTVIDANSCTATISATVNEPALLTASSTVVDVDCNANATGSIDVTVAGGTAPFTYIWTDGETTEDISAKIAGVYTVTITDDNNCSITETATITEPAVLATASVVTDVDCNGALTGAIDLTVSGGTPAYTYIWSNTQATEDLTNIADGTYTVTVTDDNNCTTTETVTVTEPAVLTASTVVTDVDCNGASTGSIDLTVGGGAAPYSFSWDSGQTTEDVAGLAAGSYCVTITDNNSCTTVTCATIAEPTALAVSTTVTDVDCNGNATGAIDLDVTGGTAPYTYSWNPGAQTTQDLNSLTAGVYDVTVTDDNGCTITTSATVNEPAVLATSSTQVDVACNGASTGSVNLTVTGGTSPYAYSWDNGETTEDIATLAAGIYCVTVTDDNACTVSTCVTITEPSAISLTTAATDVDCNGNATGAVDLTVAGGTPNYSFNWDSGQATEDIANVVAGTYCVTVTDNNGCTATTCETVAEPTILTASTTVVDVDCNGASTGSVDLTVGGGAGGYTFSWSNSEITEDLTNQPAGTYTVTITDANNCTTVTSATIAEPAVLATSSVVVDVDCNGALTGEIDLTVTGGTPVYTYVWSTSATTEDLTNLADGVYDVTVTDDNACTVTESITVTEPTILTAATVVTDADCNGNSTGSIDLTVGGGAGGYTYQWDDALGSTTEDLAGQPAGVYNVTVTDANSCITITSATINEPAALTISSTQVDVLCNGDATGSIDVTVGGGTAPYTYSWSNGATTEDLTNLTAGVYDGTVTDDNGCTISASVTITEPTVLTASTIVVDADCNAAATGSIDLTVGGGVAPYTYNWDSGQSTEDISNLTAGTYTVTVTDDNGCTTITSAVVNEPSAVTATITSQVDVLCFGNATGSATVAGSGGTGTYTYNWDNGVSTAVNAGIAAGTYCVTVSDANSCPATTCVTITEPASSVTVSAAVTSNYNGADVSCNGATDGEVTATAGGGTGAISYLWSNGQTTAVAVGVGAGVHCVTLTDDNGCQATACVTVTEPTIVAANITNSVDVLCFGDATGEATVTGSGGTAPYAFIWDDGQTTATAVGLVAGTYCVTVTDANGCNNSTCISINQPATPVAVNASETSPITCAGAVDASIEAIGTGGTGVIGYQWSNGPTTATQTNVGAGTYCVTATDANGCVATACVTVTDPAPVVISVDNVIDVTCNGASTGEATVSASGGTTPYTFAWSSGQTTTTISGVPAGNYCVTVTDASGCTATSCFNINEPATAVAVNATVTTTYAGGFNVSCFGANDGEANANATGGVGPYTYVWDINSQTTPTATGMAASTYCVTATDANGCQASACVTLTSPTPVVATVTDSVDVLCQGDATGSATVTPSGGVAPYSFLWTGGQTTATANNLTAGVYSVTVTDANGCENNATVIIEEPLSSVVAAIAVDNNVSCFSGNDGSATASASGGTAGYTYQWGGNTGGQITATANNLAAGVYCVTVTDANGCTDDECVTITEPNLVVATISNQVNVLCRDDSTGSATVQGTGGTPFTVGTPYTYQWDAATANQTTATATGLAAGSYNVTITDQNGCTSVAAATITEPAGVIDVSAAVTSDYNGQDISCFGAADGEATATAVDGTAPYTFDWGNGQTTDVATALAAGTYIVTVTDDNGCSDTALVDVIAPADLIGSVNIDNNVSCLGGSDGQATVSHTGGTAPYTYTWTDGQTTATAGNLTAGNQCVTITDANGCTNVVCVNVTEPATALNASIDTQTDASCNAACDAEATVLAAGGTAPYTYEWDGAAASQLTATATGLCAGTYDVTVTDANNCTAITSVTINAPAPVAIAIVSQTDVICKDDSTGTAQVVASGGNGAPYSYAWSDGQTGTTATGLAAGTYTVTAVDVDGCQSTQSVVIVEPAAALTLNISTVNISCNGGGDGEATANPAGGVAPYTYVWDLGGQTTQAIAGLADGTYCVTVTDDIGCAVTACVTMSEPASVTATITAQTDANCNGGADGTATVQGSGGTAPYTYLWDNTQTSATATGLAAATSPHSVTVTDANGCQAITTVIIGEPATAISASAIVDNNVSCFGEDDGQATASASGGTGAYTYQWDVNANNQITATADSLAAGAYDVTISDANGCSDVASITVTEPAEITLTVATTDVNCNGGNNGTATVTATGGTAAYSYQWDANAASQTTATANNLSAGSYNVTVTDANGCFRVAIANVSAPASVIAANIAITSNYNGAQISCATAADGEATVNVVGGSAPYTYQWSTSDVTATITGQGAGVVGVTVTDDNGCVAVDTAVFIAPDPVAIVINTTDVNCNGGADGSATAVVTGGTGGYTYNWDNGSTTTSASNLSAGSICVTVTDANGCQSALCATINEPATPVNATATVISDYNGEDVSCAGSSDGSVMVVANGGVGPYTYNWSTGSNNDTLTGLTAGVYTVTATDANGCSFNTDVTVTEPSIITVTIASSIDASCNGSADGEATATAAGGTGAYTFLWSDAAAQTTATAVNLAAGNYTVTVTDDNGCISTNNVTINQPLVGVNASAVVTSSYNGEEVSCAGSCDGEATAAGAGGTAPYSFQWGPLANNQTTAIATGLCANTTYSVTVTDDAGCTNVATVTLTEPTAISPSISSTSPVSCNSGNDGSATVAATGGTGAYTYLWTSGETAATATQLSAGTNCVTITDANGCEATACVTITEPATFLAVTVTQDTTYNGQDISCNGADDAAISVAVSGGTPAYSVIWSNGSSATSLTGLAPDTYVVSVTDAGGCTQVDSIEITEPALVTASIGSQTNIGCLGDSTGSVTITATGGTPNYTFDIGDGAGPVSSNNFNNLPAGNYTITVSDLNFCETTVNVTITEPATVVSAAAGVTSNYNGQDVSCFNACDGEATVTGTGGTAPYTYLWSLNNQTTAVATGLCGGNSYSVVITDANGCESSATVTLGNPTPIAASLVSTADVLCNGDSTGTATVTASGGTAPYTYDIGNGGQAAATFSNLGVGNYVATVTDVNGCNTTVPFIINGPPALVITNINVTSDYNGSDISCNGACDGAATVVAAGGTGTYTFLWSDGQTTFTAANLCNNASVTVTDQNGCVAVDSVNFTEPAVLTIGVTNQVDIGCAGATTGSFEVTANGGTPNYTFDIGNGPQANGIFSGLATGSYCVTVTDLNGCSDIVCTTITQGSSINLTTNVISNNNGSALSCASSADGEAEVIASGGTAPYTYLWDNGQTTATVTGLAGGTHCVTVTDANLCEQTACVTITGPAALDVVVVSTTDASCYGVADGSITVSASGGIQPAGGYIYSIDGGNSFTNQVTFNNLAGFEIAAGGITYQIIAQDANGCQDTVDATIYQPTQLQGLLVSENDVSCFGGNDGYVNVTGVGGTAPYTYSFNGGSFTATDSFPDLIAGTYNIVIQDANGCTANLPVTISEPSALVLSIDLQVNPGCNLDCDGQINISATGGTAGYTFSNDGGATFQASGAFANLCEGTYPMTAMDAQGCMTTIDVTLDDPDPVSVTASITGTISCNNAADGEATAVASGGTGAFTYVWTPSGQTTATATGLTAGVWYVVEAFDANGCSTQDSVILTEPVALAANVTLEEDPSCNGDSDGAISIQADPTTGTGPYTYDIGTGAQTSGVFTALVANTYNITITDANGCSIVENVTLTDPAAIVLPQPQVTSNYNGQDISCNGASDGAANIGAITGGTAPYSFLWSNSETTQSISGLSAGTYTVTVTDANGCFDTTSVSLTDPTLLTATATTDSAGCSGATAGQITAVGAGGTAPYAYEVNGTSNITGIFTGLTAGTYTVNVTDANDCATAVVVQIFDQSPIVASTSVISDYSGFDVSCVGSVDGEVLATATGGSGNYTYNWDNGTSNDTLSGVGAGTYYVTITDVLGGCTTTDSVIVTDPTTVGLSVVSTADLNCAQIPDGSITVNAAGGAGNYLYSIDGGAQQSGATFNGLAADTFEIVVTDNNGCTDTLDVSLTAPDSLLVELNAVDVSCNGLEDGSVTATVTGGVSYPNGGYVYVWAPNGETTSSIGDLNGNTNYTVTVEDANGCQTVETVFVAEPTQLLANIAAVQNVTCNGINDGELTIDIFGASGSYQYSTDGGTTFQNVTNTPLVLTGLAGGTYQIVVRDSGSISCEIPLSVEILENAGLDLDVTTVQVSCVDSEDGTATANVSGGAGPYVFAWNNGGGSPIISTNQTATGLDANFIDSVFVTTPYFVTVTDANGCTVSSPGVGIAEPDTLEIDAVVTQDVSCFGASDGIADVSVTGGNSLDGYVVEWSNGATTNTVSGLDGFVYAVTVTDNRGCVDSTTVSLFEPTPIVANLTTDSVSCFGGTDGLILVDTANGGISGGTPFNGTDYEFAFDAAGPWASESILGEGLPAGIYTVYVRDSNGCTVEMDSLAIFQASAVEVTAFDDQDIRMGESVDLYATVTSTDIDSSLISWYYYDNEGNQNVVCEGGNCFDITVEDLFEPTTMIFDLGNGCGDTSSVDINVSQVSSAWAPNAFTPNGDGVNDAFTIYGSVDVERIDRLLIFDRWGELVYEATDFSPNDLSAGWDGTYRTKDMNPAVFVYYVEYTTVDGKNAGDGNVLKGDVTLLR